MPILFKKYLEYLLCAWHFVGVEDKAVDEIKFFSFWGFYPVERIREELPT